MGVFVQLLALESELVSVVLQEAQEGGLSLQLRLLCQDCVDLLRRCRDALDAHSLASSLRDGLCAEECLDAQGRACATQCRATRGVRLSEVQGPEVRELPSTD